MIIEDVIAEVTGSDTTYIDSLHIDDPVDVYELLDTYVGKPGPWPAELTYLGSEGDVLGTTRVVWSTADGVGVAWRTISWDVAA